jgi:hypothetical protein
VEFGSVPPEDGGDDFATIGFIEGLWISDSGINPVEFFFNIFGVNEITHGLDLI